MKDECPRGKRRRHNSDIIRKIRHETDGYKIKIDITERNKSYEDGDFRVSARVTNQKRNISELKVDSVMVFGLPLLRNRVEKTIEKQLKKALKAMKKREDKLEIAEEAEITESKIEEMVRKVLK